MTKNTASAPSFELDRSIHYSSAVEVYRRDRKIRWGTCLACLVAVAIALA